MGATTQEIATTGAVGSSPASGATRLGSIDAYRGLVMTLMMAEVLRLGAVSRALPDSAIWGFLAHHQTHAPWTGCTLHDLIQPSFSFLVGVALPFSLANRAARGQSQAAMLGHAWLRALILVLLGVFLRSVGRPQTYWTFEDTLTQIGLGYGFLFLLAQRSTRVQWAALAVILVGYWAAFALYPVPEPGFDYGPTGVEPFGGLAAHWNKNTNLAWAFDTWFLNLFPREHVFEANPGGYSTLSFIPTLGTMILGLLAGGVLKSEQVPSRKITWLLTAGLAGLAAGAALEWSGICPVVKRIWTPAWTLYSGGWCFVLLAGFFALVEVGGLRRPVFPLAVVGRNSIAAYCIAELMAGFISGSLVTHLGKNTFRIFGSPYEPLILGGGVLICMWLILYWMHRRKIYLRI